MRTRMGWTCATGITEFNARSIGNWPVQATGADILRMACIEGHRRGLQLCGSVHDAVLIESSLERIDADVALMREIMRRASRVVLGDLSCEPASTSSAIRTASTTAAASRCGPRSDTAGAIPAAEDGGRRVAAIA